MTDTLKPRPVTVFPADADADYFGNLYGEIACPPTVQSKAAGDALPLEWAATMEAQLCGLWLIKHLLPSQGIALIYGHPGCGKSFVAIDFAFHVALGWEWNGRRVRKGLVVYVGAEGVNGLRNRMVAFRKANSLDGQSIPLALIPTPIDMQAPDADTPRLIEAIRQAALTYGGQEPALVVIDTLSKTFGAGKENTDDMASYVANCQRVASEFGCCVMPVHHRPKDAESTEPRGHSSLKGGVDTVLLIEAGSPRRISVTKQKDAEFADDAAFNLHSVDLGQDEDGDAVTSCVIEITDAAPRKSKGVKLADGPKLALAALERAIREAGHYAPADLPDDLARPGVMFKVATLKDWQALAIIATADPDKTADTIARTFRRNREKLQALNIIHVHGDYAWPA
jgi:KaiC/GvpD/RAD55 family RecA-like ATPase